MMKPKMMMKTTNCSICKYNNTLNPRATYIRQHIQSTLKDIVYFGLTRYDVEDDEDEDDD